jgi:4-hydroxy-2-oxoheptanedioate aldolase
VPALEALDEIVAVDGLDAVLVGPHDLTCSLGIPERYDDDRYLQAVDRIMTTARGAGIGAGVHVFYENAEPHEIRWGRLGMNMIVHHSDSRAFAYGMRRDVAKLRSALAGMGEKQ